MQELFDGFEVEDFEFLAGLLKSNINLSDDQEISRLLSAYAEDSTSLDKRDDLIAKIRDEIRYVGSSDIAYFYRWMRGGTAGVPVKKVFENAAKALGVAADARQTEREMAVQIATSYAEREFGNLPDDQKIELLEKLGVETEKAGAFVKRSAGVFTIPVLIKAFNIVIVDGVIKQILFGTIARILGKALSDRLFSLLVSRLPWWVGWISPVAWTASLSWTAIDIAGPALRKTIPVTLYLGINALNLDSYSFEENEA